MTTHTTEQAKAIETLDAMDPDTNRRDELRAKIEASERRIAERSLADEAREAAATATAYAKEHPLTVVGGAVAIGVVIGLMTKPGRRAARSAATGTANAVSGVASGTVKSVGKAAKRRSSDLGALVSEALIAYGIRMIDSVMDAGRAGQETLEDFGDATSARARKTKRDAEYLAGSAADGARTLSRRTRRRASRAVRNVKDRVTN